MNNSNDASLQTLVVDIAKALDGTAKLNENSISGSITGDGWMIWVNIDTYRKRITISVNFPYDSSLGYVAPRDLERNSSAHTTEITCSVTRTPAAIAKDIQRKLLPSASMFYKLWLERKNQHYNYINNQNSIAKEFESFGYTQRDTNNNGCLYATNLPNLTIGNDIRVDSFYCSAETVKKILEILKNAPEMQ